MLCIMLASCLLGNLSAGKLRRRCEFLRELEQVLMILEKEMLHHKVAMADAFRKTGRRCRTQWSALFALAADEMELRDGRTFEEIWKDCLYRCLPSDLLSAEAREAVETLSAVFGNSDSLSQKLLMESAAEQIHELQKREEKIYQEKGGLYRKLSAASGVFIILILL